MNTHTEEAFWKDKSHTYISTHYICSPWVDNKWTALNPEHFSHFLCLSLSRRSTSFVYLIVILSLCFSISLSLSFFLLLFLFLFLSQTHLKSNHLSPLTMQCNRILFLFSAFILLLCILSHTCPDRCLKDGLGPTTLLGQLPSSDPINCFLFYVCIQIHCSTAFDSIFFFWEIRT